MKIERILIKGDPCDPMDSDRIAEFVNLPTGETPPAYYAPNACWRVIGGNHRFNEWCRIVMRHEIETIADMSARLNAEWNE